MIVNRSMAPATIIPELAYPDVRAAARWLCDAFGFEVRLGIGGHRCQLSFGTGSLVVTELGDRMVDHSHAVMVRVDDIDAHYARAVANGAVILRPPADHPYGERQYTAADPAGHHWTFSQSIADVDPEDWGGTPGRE